MAEGGRRNHLGTSATALVAVLSVVLLTAGTCTTTLPSSDSTPPTLLWNIYDEVEREHTEVAGSGAFKGVRNRSYLVTLKIQDPEGVRKIRLGSSTAWSCKSGDIGQTSGPSLDAPDEATFSPDADNKVLTLAVRMRNVAMTFNCQPGFTFSSAVVELTGFGENYYQGTANGVLKLTA